MDLSWLESLIYGLVSGLAEFLPVSTHAHQQLLLHLFGAESSDPVRDLFVHLALLFSIFTGCRTLTDQIRRERKIQLQSRRGNRHTSRALLDLKLVKNASVPMLIGLLVLSYVSDTNSSLLITAVFLIFNGVLLYLPERMIQGNKDVRGMTLFDSLLIGISGALSVFPGISRMGSTASAAVARGADRQHALNWAFLLSIPALALLTGLDLVAIFTYAGEINFWTNFFTYVLSIAGAYVGGCVSIKLVKLLTVNVGFYGFAYYSWGAALFTFILYLTVV